jgi:hypothetical protein
MLTSSVKRRAARRALYVHGLHASSQPQRRTRGDLALFNARSSGLLEMNACRAAFVSVSAAPSSSVRCGLSPLLPSRCICSLIRYLACRKPCYCVLHHAADRILRSIGPMTSLPCCILHACMSRVRVASSACMPCTREQGRTTAKERALMTRVSLTMLSRLVLLLHLPWSTWTPRGVLERCRT